ncbi:Translation elongation factor EF1B/ribosomal protein S6 family protein [Prunus dulcis]|uniref:Translation elongation factor EF1B/ribosomal protein S6 family protein n=1 Tax=Prunus dulcis TaxID=3755 RepID=A0A4Y1QMI0_PRUDU|nr:Translation elongation factor EF1B/ribosomal protein S6 family protein [Prunus dulcis]
METLKLVNGNGSSRNQISSLEFANGYSSFSSRRPLTSEKLSVGRRKSVIVGAKKNNNKEKKKNDNHSFVSKPDEATGLSLKLCCLKRRKFRKMVNFSLSLLTQKKVYEFLKLQLQSDLNEERMRHYEVVYLINEKHVEEVGSVKEKIQGFLREKKARIWRVSDWGMRRLAYHIKKAKNAYYILMNFEIEAKWINDFKTMLDKDERVIRHLVMKRDEAITEDCPPPPEFHTAGAGTDSDEEEEEDMEYDDEEYGDEDGIIIVDADNADIEDRKQGMVEQVA